MYTNTSVGWFIRIIMYIVSLICTMYVHWYIDLYCACALIHSSVSLCTLLHWFVSCMCIDTLICIVHVHWYIGLYLHLQIGLKFLRYNEDDRVPWQRRCNFKMFYITRTIGRKKMFPTCRIVIVQIFSRATVPKEWCSEGTKEGMRNRKIERPGEIRWFVSGTYKARDILFSRVADIAVSLQHACAQWPVCIFTGDESIV